LVISFIFQIQKFIYLINILPVKVTGGSISLYEVGRRNTNQYEVKRLCKEKYSEKNEGNE